jgi:hypothetical protein
MISANMVSSARACRATATRRFVDILPGKKPEPAAKLTSYIVRDLEGWTVRVDEVC